MIHWPIGGRLDSLLRTPGAKPRLWRIACEAARIHGHRLAVAKDIRLELLQGDRVRVTSDGLEVVVVNASDLTGGRLH